MSPKSLLVVVLMAATVSARGSADPAREPYVAALAQERVVRAAMSAPDAPASTVTQVRDVVTAYRNVVKQYPASGYSDNALWQAGRLALDAYVRFGETRDHDTAVRLLNALVASYPTSKLVKQVPEQLARAQLPAMVTAAAPAASAVPAAAPATSPASALATVRSIKRTPLPDGIRLVIELDAEVSFHEERLADPARVFVDLASTKVAADLRDRTLRFDGDSDIVHQVRVGRHPDNTTRVVFDAMGVGKYSIYPLYDPYRLVIDCVRGLAPPPLLTAHALNTAPIRRLPLVAPRAGTALAEAYAVLLPPPALPTLPSRDDAPRTAAIGVGAPSTSTAPPAKNSGGGFSIARQLGLGVSRIVIDPGHGGHDPGAQGKGIDEAELVLDVSLRLEKLLQKVPGVEVILTRRTDDFIPLQERTAIANREGADLFLSVHANASTNPQARGIETYFLNFANSMGAAAVAARENAASGQSMGALPDFVKAIALNNKLDESRDFASAVQRSMFDRLRGPNKTLKDLGVKQAPFVVLIGAAMPSVLAEISFVTNPQESKLLKATAYRQRIAEALYGAVRRYQTSLKVQTVAHQ